MGEKAREYVAYSIRGDVDEAKDELEKVWRDGRSIATAQPLSELATVRGVSTHGQAVVVELEPKQGAGVAVKLLRDSDTPFAAS